MCRPTSVMSLRTAVTGQSDIKKLRRENDHLRRELWALREECDRLQELLKHRVSTSIILSLYSTLLHEAFIFLK